MEIFIALLLDNLLGDPKGWPHPIRFIGRVISLWEKVLYKMADKRTAGALQVLATLGTVLGLIGAVLALLARWPLAQTIACIYLLYAAIGWRALKVEAGYAADAVQAGNIPKARRMLSYIVGRDTQDLSPIQILKATIETVAENTIDGVLAPLLYACLGYWLGGPVPAVIFIYAYKCINTMDSMIGYKNERYLHYGTAAARLDDVVNFIPARLGAMLMLICGGLLGYNFKRGWQSWLEFRYAHKSPNSAQSESVIAGLLGLQLGGPAYYFGELVTKPTIGRGIKHPEYADFVKTCRVLDWSVYGSAIIFAFFLLGRLAMAA